MKRKYLCAVIVILLVSSKCVFAALSLSGEWNLIKKTELAVSKINEVSMPGYKATGWLKSFVPGSVQNDLLLNGLIKDPYYAMNNGIPNCGDGLQDKKWIKTDVWVYRKEFNVPDAYKGKRVWLKVNGINHTANVYLNGSEIGNIRGMYNRGIYDVTDKVIINANNCLALEVTPPAQDRKKSITCAVIYGWDQGVSLEYAGVGIWQEVSISTTGPLMVRDPHVSTKLESKELAKVTVFCYVVNAMDTVVDGRITAALAGINVSKEVSLQPKSSSEYELPVMEISNPKLWWPNGYGEQNLYDLKLVVDSNGKASDVLNVKTGVRELKMVNNKGINSPYKFTFNINGENIFSKGGDWLPVDALLRLTPDKYERQIFLLKKAGLNMVRVWGGGLIETDMFYDLCNRNGIMVWQDFPLAGIMQSFYELDPSLLFDNVKDSILKLRHNPCLVMWCGGNEFSYDDNLQLINEMKKLVNKNDGTRFFQPVSWDGVNGQGDTWTVYHGGEPYTAYHDNKVSFQAESGMPAVPVLASLKKFIPESNLWPPDEVWAYHNWYNSENSLQGEKMGRYLVEYGSSDNLNEFIMKSQLVQAVTDRYQLEFCRSSKFVTSGCLIWQFNEVWPGCNWTLVDYYGRPKAGYYSYKRAAKPLLVMADYTKYVFKPGEKLSCNIYVVNDNLNGFAGLTAKATVLSYDMKKLWEQSITGDITSNSSTKLMPVKWNIPKDIIDDILFLKLTLNDTSGKVLSDNFYWFAVTKKKPVEDPVYKKLDNLPMVKLEIKSASVKVDSNYNTSVSVKNLSENLGFFIWLEADLPENDLVDYSDNYFNMLPGEEKVIEITSNSMPLDIAVKGWNISDVVK